MKNLETNMCYRLFDILYKSTPYVIPKQRQTELLCSQLFVNFFTVLKVLNLKFKEKVQPLWVPYKGVDIKKYFRKFSWYLKDCSKKIVSPNKLSNVKEKNVWEIMLWNEKTITDYTAYNCSS